MGFASDRIRNTPKATHPLEDVFRRFNDEALRTIEAIEQQYKGAKALPLPKARRPVPRVPLGG